ncbi:NAD(P)H-binding protein [Flavobacterium caeni]|uniref:Nucleoside-diphosphate-sugar epimerase n=1 Tax=Flavobacterium caeni TaxID=490189 RepID=A0A1G5DZC5_9FLAO|nr:NAD(P)H-binding protein [Flavobacterium caeni]SCY20092.1 Nucleoside-diphosphate-sugar epimerase [Flavobacterium caeni]
MKTISLLGCGWLGIPLAEALLQRGFDVNGSTTSAGKIPLLERKGIRPFLVTLDTDGVEGEIDRFLDADVLVIDIPPRFHFSKKIESLLPYIEQSTVKKVLLVSATSVYGQADGLIDEATEPVILSEKSAQLLGAENHLRNQPGFDTTVVRLGGLIGPDRHPIFHLAGQSDLENPEAPVNLIHLQDCIGILCKILETDAWGETFNAVAPYHPTREQYYTQKAAERHLPPPQFSHAQPSAGKTITATKVQRQLDYRFEFPEL